MGVCCAMRRRCVTFLAVPRKRGFLWKYLTKADADRRLAHGDRSEDTMKTGDRAVKESFVPEDRDHWIGIVERYIGRCLDLITAPRASELAYELRISAVRLTRHFKRAVGIDISTYMKQRQLELAKH